MTKTTTPDRAQVSDYDHSLLAVALDSYAGICRAFAKNDPTRRATWKQREQHVRELIDRFAHVATIARAHELIGECDATPAGRPPQE